MFPVSNAKSQAQIKGKNIELKLFVDFFLPKKKSPLLLKKEENEYLEPEEVTMGIWSSSLTAV